MMPTSPPKKNTSLLFNKALFIRFLVPFSHTPRKSFRTFLVLLQQKGMWNLIQLEGGRRNLAYKNLNKIQNHDVASVKGRVTAWNRSQSPPCWILDHLHLLHQGGQRQLLHTTVVLPAPDWDQWKVNCQLLPVPYFIYTLMTNPMFNMKKRWNY